MDRRTFGLWLRCVSVKRRSILAVPLLIDCAISRRITVYFGMLTTRDQIAAQWHAFCELPFPKGCGSLDPNGVCLANADTNAAGCSSSYIDAPLPLEKVLVLRRCRDDLELALAVDLPEHIREYFAELTDMATFALSCELEVVVLI